MSSFSYLESKLKLKNKQRLRLRKWGYPEYGSPKHEKCLITLNESDTISRQQSDEGIYKVGLEGIKKHIHETWSVKQNKKGQNTSKGQRWKF